MITKVKVTNWRKFAETKEWQFDEGVQLIFGPNTSGKSSVLDAIYFAFRGVDEQIDDNPCYDSSQSAIVIVDFIGVDGNKYRIVRSYKKIKRKEEDFVLYKLENGTEVSLSKNSEEAMKLFGIGGDIFTHIFFLKEGEIYRALLRSKNHLSEEIATIMNLEKMDELVSKFQKVRTTRIKKLKEKASKQKTLDVEREEELKQKIETLNQKIREMEEKQNKVKNLLKLVADKHNMSEEIKNLENRKLDAGNMIRTIREKYRAQDLKDYLQSELSKLNNETKKLQNQQQELIKEEYSKNAEVKQINKNIAAINEFEKAGYATCPTCYQKVDPIILKEAKNSFIEKKNKLEKELEMITKKLNELKKSINETQNRIKMLTEDLQNITEAIDKVSYYQKQINELNEKLAELPETEPKEVYNQKLNEIENEIRELEVKKRLNEQNLANLAKEKVLSVEEVEFQEQFVKLLEKTIKEHKKEILDQKLTEVKQLIKNEWKELMNENIWGVEFDKQFVPILDYKGTKRSIKGLSGSEKIMLSIIVRAAFMHKIMSNKTLVLDDPTISLDDVHLERSAKFYKKLIEKKYLKQIILSSFNYRFKEFLQADKVIELA